MKIEISNQQSKVDCSPQSVRRVLEATLREEGSDANLSVALVEDGRMLEMNRRFTGRSDVTDVLAFPYGSDEDGLLHGEIVVNADQALREATERPHGAEGELMLYLVHGLLHLLGYDDHDPEDSRLMRRREQRALRSAGYDVEY